MTSSRISSPLDARSARAQRLVYSQDDLQRALTDIAAAKDKSTSILIAGPFRATKRFSLPANAPGLVIEALPSAVITVGAAMDALFRFQAHEQAIRHVRITGTAACAFLVEAVAPTTNAGVVELGGLVVSDCDTQLAPTGIFTAPTQRIFRALITGNVMVGAHAAGAISGVIHSSVIAHNRLSEDVVISGGGGYCAITSNVMPGASIDTSASDGLNTIVGNVILDGFNGTITPHATDVHAGLNT